MSALTRGPLPARVYWTRRVVVLGALLVLVLGGTRLLSSGSDGSSGDEPRAVRAGATSTPGGTGRPSLPAPVRLPKEKQGKAQQEKAQREKAQQEKAGQAPVLARPEGPCLDTDVAVTPAVRRPVAGRTVRLVLELRTISSPACTWRVSSRTVTLKVTSGDDEIWTSRQCPRAVPTRDVVLRSAKTTRVGVRWSGRRSDDECSRLTEWALPGWYHVAAAALAGEPADLQFELRRPARPVVTAAPRPGKSDRDRDRDRDKNQDRDRDRGQDRDRDRDRDEPRRR